MRQALATIPTIFGLLVLFVGLPLLAAFLEGIL